MNYTYLLECADKTLYCGWTNNLEKRVKAHNTGQGAKYTKPRRPVTLVYYEEFATKEEAMRREAAIKKLSRKEKAALIKEKRDMENYKNVEMRGTAIAYKKWRKWVEVPYEAIVQAYRQVEEAKANICCGQAYFEMHRVILVTNDGKKTAVEVPDRDTGVEILDALKEKNPGIIIGIGKKKEQAAEGENK